MSLFILVNTTPTYVSVLTGPSSGELSIKLHFYTFKKSKIKKLKVLSVMYVVIYNITIVLTTHFINLIKHKT
jgi:hypothetical protein